MQTVVLDTVRSILAYMQASTNKLTDILHLRHILSAVCMLFCTSQSFKRKLVANLNITNLFKLKITEKFAQDLCPKLCESNKKKHLDQSGYPSADWNWLHNVCLQFACQ